MPFSLKVEWFFSDFCSLNLSAEGVLLTPNHPFYYGKDLNCFWDIVAAEGQYAALNVTWLQLASEVEDILVATLVWIILPYPSSCVM